MEFDLSVVIGRFQPYHLGHAALLQQALQLAPRVLVVLGSAGQAPDIRNPFSWQERAAMIGATLSEDEQARVQFAPVRDYYDDRRWQLAVERAVAGVLPQRGARVVLVGHAKDASSYYLQRFPGWSVRALPRQADIDATSLRQIWFELDHPQACQALLGQHMPPAVVQYLQGWTHLPLWQRLREEYFAVEKSRQVWGDGPFITVDAVVRAADHILLVQRRHAPGAGLWALPGGFLDGRERVLQGAVRELREETGLALLDSTLEAALRGVAVFDHPDRSVRGRTLTHAHYFDLGDVHLPAVEAADDAAAVRWVALADVPALQQQLFEDHFHILDHFLLLEPA